MIYIYRRAASDSALLLADAVEGIRVRNHLRIRQPAHVVCWGEHMGGDHVLNGGSIRSKFQDAIMLKNAGVATIEVRLSRPEPIDWRYQVTLGPFLPPDQVRILIAHLQEWLAKEPPVNGEWIPRLNSHVGGNDLLSPPAVPQYWVKKESIVREFRVHSFMGRSIRSGMKIPNADSPAHEWIRSYDAGWRISYDGRSVRQAHRDLAHQAVKALGLNFGAVDIGERVDGSSFVLEVNRAPGLSGGTISAYADAITKWSQG